MKVKREKAQIKVKKDKYYFVDGSKIRKIATQEDGGRLGPTTPDEIRKEATQLGNTVLNVNSLSYRNLSQVDDSWVYISSTVKNWSRVQGNSKIDVDSHLHGNITVNNSKLMGCNILNVNNCVIENSTISSLKMNGVENIVIKNAKINNLTIVGNDIKIIDCEVSGGGILGEINGDKHIGSVELNGCKITFSGIIHTNDVKIINSDIKMNGEIKISNCTMINSDVDVTGYNFYLTDLCIENSKLVSNGSENIYIKNYLYNSNVTFSGSSCISLRLRERTANTIIFSGVSASSSDFLEITNCKNENLTISGDCTGTKISGYAKFINSIISDIGHTHIGDNALIENSTINGIGENYICEKAHIINSNVKVYNSTIKGNATINGEINIFESIIFGNAYVKNLTGVDNMIFNSSVVESYSSNSRAGTYIGGNSYVNGKLSGVLRTYTAIIDSKYQITSDNVRIKTSEVYELYGSRDISEKIVINSDSSNFDDEILFNEHDNRKW